MNNDVTWVAVAGFGLSVISLVWQAILTWLRLPRLEVGISAHRGATLVPQNGPPQPMTYFDVTIHNRGAEPVEIYDLGLMTETGVRISLREGETTPRTLPSGKRDVKPFGSGETLPATIPARSTRQWRIHDDATAEHGAALAWQAWAERYRASGGNKMVKSKKALWRFSGGVR